MKITIKRTGGLLGIAQTKSIVVEELPHKTSHYLIGIIEKIDFFSLPERLDFPPQADRFSYTISIITEEQQHTITRSEEHITSDLQELITIVYQSN